MLDDADLDYAVNASAFGSASTRDRSPCLPAAYVERGIGDEFVNRLAEKTKGLKAGDPNEQDTIIGPLIMSRRSRSPDGATILAGGEAVWPSSTTQMRR